MSRQLEVDRETREAKRVSSLVRALEFGLAGAVSNQGMQLLGIAIKYEDLNSLLTIKAKANGRTMVAFVGSDSMMNCILTAEAKALGNTLQWRADRYQKDVT